MNRIYPLFLLMMLLSSSGVYSSDNKWGVRIELSKQEFVLHEPIRLDVTLTNITSDTLRTHGLTLPTCWGFYIVLSDGEGRQMKYTGPQYSVAGYPGDLVLEAGEQDYGNYDLLESFGSKTQNSGYHLDRGPCTWFPFIPKGSYTVQVGFEGDLSNELSFNVVEPYGEEQEVLRIVERASKVLSLQDPDPAARIFAEVQRDYPNSVYAEMCYYLSRMYSREIWDRYPGYDKRILHREIFWKFPNSVYTEGWLLSITRDMNDDEKIALYDKVIEDHPDTRASKIANLLKKRIMAKREEGK